MKVTIYNLYKIISKYDFSGPPHGNIFKARENLR